MKKKVVIKDIEINPTQILKEGDILFGEEYHDHELGVFFYLRLAFRNGEITYKAQPRHEDYIPLDELRDSTLLEDALDELE